MIRREQQHILAPRGWVRQTVRLSGPPSFCSSYLAPGSPKNDHEFRFEARVHRSCVAVAPANRPRLHARAVVRVLAKRGLERLHEPIAENEYRMGAGQFIVPLPMQPNAATRPDARERREENADLKPGQPQQKPLGHGRRASALVRLLTPSVLRHVTFTVVTRRGNRESAPSREWQKFCELLHAGRVGRDEQ